MRGIALRFAFLLLIAGCVQAFEPSEAWTELDQPQQYLVWHGEVEACLGTRRAFGDIRWRIVHVETFPCGNILAWGCYIHPRTIYIIERLRDHEPLIKGELIHYIRRDSVHDDRFYQCVGGPL